jgi:hypothetical protein
VWGEAPFAEGMGGLRGGYPPLLQIQLILKIFQKKSKKF